VDELDFLWSNMDKFTMSQEPGYYRVSTIDGMRPDKVSYKAYGTVNYWWVICLANGIDSPLETLEVGTLLKIPSKYDIYNFSKKYRVR